MVNLTRQLLERPDHEIEKTFKTSQFFSVISIRIVLLAIFNQYVFITISFCNKQKAI